MTTPAQYEAAIRALESSIREMEPHDPRRESVHRQPALREKHMVALDGYRAALAIVREAREVRDTVAARMDGWLAHYPEDVFPPTPVTDAQSAQVLRLMLPRIKADLLEALSAEGHACAGAVEPTPFTPDPQR